MYQFVTYVRQMLVFLCVKEDTGLESLIPLINDRTGGKITVISFLIIMLIS